MNHSVAIIAKYTYLEAIRNRLFIFFVLGIICAYGLSKFIGEISITERTQIEISLLSSGLRLFIIFIMSLFVTTSIVREFNDKGFELVLSHPVARVSYYFGKAIGFGLMSIFLAILASLILLLHTPLLPVIYWCVSLICELLIINSLAIMCLFTFNNITLSFSAVVLFYLLARTMDVIQLISESPILETNSISQTVINVVLDCIAYLLPNLNNFTKTVWLVYESVSISDLYTVIGQTLIYLTLLSAIALFDLYRKEF